MVDCDRQHLGDAAGKGHDSGPACPDPAPESGGQVETPVPGISAGRFIHTHHPPGNRCLQAEEDGQFDKHYVNLYARRSVNVSTTGRQENPLPLVWADDGGR